MDFAAVDRHNFFVALPAICAAVRDATFVAIDAEFTGLSEAGKLQHTTAGLDVMIIAACMKSNCAPPSRDL